MISAVCGKPILLDGITPGNSPFSPNRQSRTFVMEFS
jgi:hypothetical protein